MGKHSYDAWRAYCRAYQVRSEIRRSEEEPRRPLPWFIFGSFFLAFGMAILFVEVTSWRPNWLMVAVGMALTIVGYVFFHSYLEGRRSG